MKRKLLCILLFVLSCGIMFSATYSGDFSLRLLKIGSNKTGFCRYDDAYNDNPDESALTVVDFTLAEQPSESETDSERATAQFGVFWDVYSGEASETNVNLKLSFSASDDNLNEAMLVNTEAEGSVRRGPAGDRPNPGSVPSRSPADRDGTPGEPDCRAVYRRQAGPAAPAGLW